VRHGPQGSDTDMIGAIVTVDDSRLTWLTALRLLLTCWCAPEQGFEGFLSSKDALRKRNRQLKPEDRSFSLCSVTSPAVCS
jgi:hypothetical protein